MDAPRPSPPPAPPIDESVPVYVISVAAELSGLHPQTLRQYDRLGLVSPGRSAGGGRRYSARDIALLRQVQELTALGLGLEGVRKVLQLENEVLALQARVADLEARLESSIAEVHAAYRRDLVPVRPSGSLVVWRPNRSGSSR